ncbi:MAG: DUF1294 domain-containing protein [Methanomassiliicoccaceae archaeon]|nr:DUF1294 domain-containing protein [Methanomassiliicoccaceae archaeon]
MIAVLLLFLAAYAALNAAAFCLFGIDKGKAVKGGRRIRESTLLASGALGPFGAAAGMSLFRHKTRKMKFKAVHLFLALHVAAAVFIVWESGTLALAVT